MFVSQLFAAIWASAALMISGAADAQQLTAQQERMQSCNAEAKDKDLKGDARQNFMSRCLKGERLSAQQEKMKS